MRIPRFPKWWPKSLTPLAPTPCVVNGHIWRLAYLSGYEAKWSCTVCAGAIVCEQTHDWWERRPDPRDEPTS